VNDTVGRWLEARIPPAPPALARRVAEVLAPHAGEPASTCAAHCVAEAERLLETLLRAECAGRERALDLLTVDTLMTYAFEAASEAGEARDALEPLARRAVLEVARLAAAASSSDEATAEC
jgi:hypothetical protein